MFAYIENSEVSVYPVTMSWLKSQHPNVSFPKNLSDVNDLTPFGIVQVVSTDQPTYSDDTHYLQELPPELVDGQWMQRWNTVAFSDDIIATYRQSLRDVPAQTGFPDSIDWPSKPT